MILLILIPFIVQAIAIGLDEYYFHLKRGLPLWERIGHPLDTLSVFGCLLFVLLVPYSSFALKWYIGLGIFSCLMITKDEWVHKHHCPASEQWLHALLFINHPIMLASVGSIWWMLAQGEDLPSWLASHFHHPITLQTLLVGQAAAIALFFCYQVTYWNFIWKKDNQK